MQMASENRHEAGRVWDNDHSTRDDEQVKLCECADVAESFQ